MSAYFVLSQPEWVESLAESANETLTEQLNDYVGQSDWAPGSSGQATLPFGWKDPRNTFTLPVWRQVFPNLKTINVTRHGVDVAASLARRHSQALRSATGDSLPSALTVIQDHALGILSSRRGWTLSEAFTMWEQYVEKAEQESADLGDRALDIRFEELLMQPEKVIPAIARFCGVPAPAGNDTIVERLTSSRAFAFRRDPELVAFAESVRDMLHRHGYEP
jgi:hypothetical protein